MELENPRGAAGAQSPSELVPKSVLPASLLVWASPVEKRAKYDISHLCL